MFFQYQTAKGGFPVSPDDNNNLPKVAVGLHVVSAGDIHVIMHNNDEMTWHNVQPGPFGISVRKVFQTGTTATVEAMTHE
ncbi:MAG: hypothetical protein AB2766_11605 [Candidatus Thiodiazotropha endolucinida]